MLQKGLTAINACRQIIATHVRISKRAGNQRGGPPSNQRVHIAVHKEVSSAQNATVLAALSAAASCCRRGLTAINACRVTPRASHLCHRCSARENPMRVNNPLHDAVHGIQQSRQHERTADTHGKQRT
jgi:hypothetical protein